jgi:hypothetical protein
MRAVVQRIQTLLVTSELALWRYDNAFLPNNRRLILELPSYVQLLLNDAIRPNDTADLIALLVH